MLYDQAALSVVRQLMGKGGEWATEALLHVRVSVALESRERERESKTAFEVILINNKRNPFSTDINALR